MSFPSKSGSHPIKDEVGYRLSMYIYIYVCVYMYISLSNVCSLPKMQDTKPQKSRLDSGRSRQLASKTRMRFYTVSLFSPVLDLQ